jgi:glycosyltransferase involved in cell wall biosynthesis
VIRVGVVCDIFEIGGQEMGCLDVLRRLDRARFRPYLYTFRPGALLGEAQALGIPVLVGHDKPGTVRDWTPADRAAVVAYRPRLAAALRADAIDVCLIYGWRDGPAAATEAGVPAVVERVDGPTLLGRIRDKSACQRVICQSRTVRRLLLAQRSLIRCVPRRVVVIPTGIDLARFDPARYDRVRERAALGLAPEAFAVGAVSRLAPEKDLGHLLRALRLLADGDATAGHRTVALLVGPDGGARAALEAEARALGLTDRVRFLGPRADVPAVLRALDVFALTSRYEGVPLALLEAMAMGLPVVATAVGSIPEVVDGNAYLVQEPPETAAALGELYRDPALRHRLGRRGRRRARAHDVETMVRRYEAVLTEALAEARGAG